MLEYFAQNKIQSNLPYEPNDFLFRWKKIERIVSKENIDGLLLIAGADSNNNQNTTKLLNWLLFGYSGQLIAKNSYLPEHFQQIILFISKNSNAFLHPKARKQLSQYVYCIPTMDVFSPTQQEFENKETLDILKISQFYRIVKDHKRIGVLGDAKSIQKWPLIQSFALEQVGGAFFSMKYHIEDLSAKIQSVYKNHDKHSLKSIYQIISKRMQGYLIGTTSIIQNTDIENRSSITEFQLNEPINESIQIQQLQQSGNGLEKPAESNVSVLIGSRTNDSTNKSGETIVGQNHHMTLDYADPNTLLRVCRTYFLSNGSKLIEQLVEEDVAQEDTFIVDKVYSLKRQVNKQYKDQHVLLTLYSYLIEATLEGIVGITKDYRNLNAEFFKAAITTKLSTVLKDLYSFFPLLSIESELFSYNSLGELQKVDFKDIISFKLTPHYHIIKTSIKDIPSPNDQKKVLGSVIFSQSFILQQGCYMLLTKYIPYFDIYNCHDHSTIYKNLNPNIEFQQLGKVVSQGVPDCKLLVLINPLLQIKCVNIPLMEITIYFHEKGLRIYSQKLGWLIVPSEYFKQITLINNIDGYWVQVQLIDQLILSDYSSNQIILGFTPKAQELFQVTIIDKLNQNINFIEINQTPQHLAENDYFLKTVLKQKDIGLLTHSQVVNSQFLFSYLEAKQLMILNSMKDLKLNAFRSIYNKPDGPLDQKELSKPKIIVINGIYASGKNRFATNLLRYARQNRFDASIFTISHENLPNKLQLQTVLSMLSQFIAEKPQRANSLTLVVLPCWINSKQFLDAAVEKYHIRSVCTKINASNFYSTLNYQLTQNTLTYTTSGYNQLVFIDTYGQDEEYLSDITAIVWNYTPDSKVYSIENNSITSGVARDIYGCDKYMKESQIFLRSKYLALYEFRLNFELRFVEIRVPVRTKDAIQRLKEQQGYLYSAKLVERQLERQRLQVEASKDQLLETLFKIKTRITLQKRKGLAMRLKWLKGNLRFVDEKQIQQLTWTNLFYRQKGNKGAQVLGLSILSTKWNEHEFLEFIDDLSEKGEFLKKIRDPVTIESLTAEQVKSIEKQNRDKYLENGQFFDGSFFRDCEGNILKSHPKLHHLLKQYVQSENLSRIQFNKLVLEQWDTYKNSFKK